MRTYTSHVCRNKYTRPNTGTTWTKYNVMLVTQCGGTGPRYCANSDYIFHSISRTPGAALICMLNVPPEQMCVATRSNVCVRWTIVHTRARYIVYDIWITYVSTAAVRQCTRTKRPCTTGRFFRHVHASTHGERTTQECAWRLRDCDCATIIARRQAGTESEYRLRKSMCAKFDCKFTTDGDRRMDGFLMACGKHALARYVFGWCSGASCRELVREIIMRVKKSFERTHRAYRKYCYNDQLFLLFF